jgi:crotonobetainyl-CoA:carnitine CoA-transferase CaiB-like acyl-CoA transferase
LRVEHKQELFDILAEILRQKTKTEWADLLDAADVPSAPIQSVGEVANHPHTQARRMIESVEHPTAGPVRITGRPIKFVGREPEPLRPAPLLGQHSEEVLRDILGYQPDRIASLVEERAVGLLSTGAEI